ncbi:hypothetical protein BCR33DRAFT_721966 [Rhizoclosmatium globosum]|uniref:3'-5' exonuclease domain-containing protein n=1 Tax=Rhizoclosmatium globosum TaxID=329046 RepID=A0A1Y2BNV8_9FUNG|nr:hypothetical protein BCR33DRAFT_721966 [Rhizoclosmatium globosum]|eukprot:ORY36432.1 hypothetical protein BCR33DRAFT_721966 [Rhizoclosmatium globosum]
MSKPPPPTTTATTATTGPGSQRSQGRTKDKEQRPTPNPTKRPSIVHALPPKPRPTLTTSALSSLTSALRSSASLPPQKKQRLDTPSLAALAAPTTTTASAASSAVKPQTRPLSKPPQTTSTASASLPRRPQTTSAKPYFSGPKKNFIQTYDALVKTLRLALDDEQLKSNPFDLLTPAQQEKALRKGKGKVPDIFLFRLKRLMEPHLPDNQKPFCFFSYCSFFPTAFKINKGGNILVQPEDGSDPVLDADRINFTASNNLPDLPYPLIKATLPQNYEIVYGTTKEICDSFVLSELVHKVNKDGSWTPKPNLILGFDTETTHEAFAGSPKQPSRPSLLQFSTSTKCLLVHQHALSQPSLPDSLIWVLTHPDIKKVCASAAQEVIDLKKFNGLLAQSFHDVAHPHGIDPGRSGPSGLAALSAVYLGLRVAKPRKIQIGDWTRPLGFLVGFRMFRRLWRRRGICGGMKRVLGGGLRLWRVRGWKKFLEMGVAGGCNEKVFQEFYSRF